MHGLVRTCSLKKLAEPSRAPVNAFTERTLGPARKAFTQVSSLLVKAQSTIERFHSKVAKSTGESTAIVSGLCLGTIIDLVLHQRTIQRGSCKRRSSPGADVRSRDRPRQHAIGALSRVGLLGPADPSILDAIGAQCYAFTEILLQKILLLANALNTAVLKTTGKAIVFETRAIVLNLMDFQRGSSRSRCEYIRKNLLFANYWYITIFNTLEKEHGAVPAIIDGWNEAFAGGYGNYQTVGRLIRTLLKKSVDLIALIDEMTISTGDYVRSMANLIGANEEEQHGRNWHTAIGDTIMGSLFYRMKIENLNVVKRINHILRFRKESLMR